MRKIKGAGLASIMLCAGLFLNTGNVLAQTHLAEICLGWTGGSAGNGYKWVGGNITWSGNQATITYDWAGIGTMRGNLQGGVLRGSWQQRGSSGGFYFSLPDSRQRTALGKWWNNNTPDRKNGMTVTTDLSRCRT